MYKSIKRIHDYGGFLSDEGGCCGSSESKAPLQKYTLSYFRKGYCMQSIVNHQIWPKNNIIHQFITQHHSTLFNHQLLRLVPPPKDL